MARQRLVILGPTGMLGSMVLGVLDETKVFDLIAVYRSEKQALSLKQQYPEVRFQSFDAEKASPDNIRAVIQDADWVINAIGVIKPYIHEDNSREIERAIKVNAYFPHLLAAAAKKSGAKVIQIATDCVYSGQKGQYVETDLHDALDVYGKTKSLGEVFDHFYHLRCSIIGPELKDHNSLLDWFLSNPDGAQLSGYTNHKWNGVTTLHFARLCYGVIKKGAELPHVQHIVPGNVTSKAELLKIIAREYKRNVVIKDKKASVSVDRTLSTNNQKLNRELWQLAGYETPPTIEKMIKELANYQKGINR